MSFPTSPTNGQISVLNDINYVYNSANLSWTRIAGVLTSTNYLTITGTTSSINSTTGALVVVGGVGIQGDVNVGGNINITGILTASNFVGTFTGFVAGNVSGTASTASNIGGGGPGQLIYQVATSSTAFVGTGTSGQVLVSYGTSGPSFTSTISLTSLTITSPIDSSSNTTGALQVVGGVGIGGSLYVAGVVTATNFFAGTLRINSGSTLTTLVITGTNIASSTVTGAVQVAGGVGIGGNLYVGSVSTFTNTLNVNNTAVSTSTNTGALRVTGGAGIGGNLAVGGIIYANSLTTFPVGSNANLIVDPDGAGDLIVSTATDVIIYSPTAATSNVSGALRVVGGIGVGGDIYFGGNLYQNGTLFTGGGGGGTTTIIANNTGTTTTFVISNTTTSISTTTGALTVAGGVGVQGNLYVGGDLYDSGAKILATRSISVYQPGSLITTVGTIRWYAPFDITVTKINAWVITAPGASITISLAVNGGAIADVLIAGAGYNSTTYSLPINVDSGSYLTLNVTPSDTNAATGSDLYVVILYQAR